MARKNKQDQKFNIRIWGEEVKGEILQKLQENLNSTKLGKNGLDNIEAKERS